MRGDFRIELPQAACRGIAWIRELALARFLLTGIEPLEIALEHQHLAAHLDETRNVLTRKPEWNRTNRAHILSDVLPRRAIAARGGLHEPPVLVAQRDRETVELELARV